MALFNNLGTADDLRKGITSFGAAADALFGQKANKLSAAGYREAAASSRKNEEYSKMSTDIKLMQADRAITKTIGGQQADVASSGFAQSGSALDILADSMREGELTRTLVETQGDIELNNIQMQTRSFELQADAAETAAKRSGLSAIINGISGVLSLGGFGGIGSAIGGIFGGASKKPGE